MILEVSSQSGEKAPLHTGATLDKQGKVWDKSPFRSENRNLPSEEFLRLSFIGSVHCVYILISEFVAILHTDSATSIEAKTFYLQPFKFGID